MAKALLWGCMQVSGTLPQYVYFLYYHLISKQLMKLVVFVCVRVYYIISHHQLVSILNHSTALGTSFCRNLRIITCGNGPRCLLAVSVAYPSLLLTQIAFFWLHWLSTANIGGERGCRRRMLQRGGYCLHIFLRALYFCPDHQVTLVS